MPATFARTMRTLARDRSSGSLLVLAGGGLLLAAWLAWFLLARLPVEVESVSARLETQRDELRVVAAFRAMEARGRLHPGQTARLQLDALPGRAGNDIHVTVMQVAPDSGSEHLEAVLAMGDAGRSLQPGLMGRVTVEVERLSPLALVLRHAGGAVTDSDLR